MQPRGVNGGSASKISLIVPTPASSRWGTKPSRNRAGAGGVVGVDLQPGVDERADQPGPDGALVIGGVAGAQVAVVVGLVVRVARRERAQADGRQQALAARPRATGSQRERSRTGWGREMAKTWFGRQAGSSPSSPSTTS